MAFTHKHTRTTGIQGRSESKTLEVTAEVQQSGSIAIVDAATDLVYEVAFLHTKLKSIYIETDQDLTLETNDGTRPQETIPLKAALPYQWVLGEERALPFSGAITAFYFTNASGSTANVKIEVLYDEI